MGLNKGAGDVVGQRFGGGAVGQDSRIDVDLVMAFELAQGADQGQGGATEVEEVIVQADVLQAQVFTPHLEHELPGRNDARDVVGEDLGGRAVRQDRRVEVDLVVRLELAQGADQGQGSAAEIEEVVIQTDVLQTQVFAPDLEHEL